MAERTAPLQDIVAITQVFCPPRYVQEVSEEYEDTARSFQGEVVVLLYGITEKARRGFVVFGWKGAPAPQGFLAKLQEDEEIEEVLNYELPGREHAESQPAQEKGR